VIIIGLTTMENVVIVSRGALQESNPKDYKSIPQFAELTSRNSNISRRLCRIELEYTLSEYQD
jgi:hypothetical protein